MERGNMKKKVLVTGATGFLGSHVVEDLMEKGYEVVATGRNQKKKSFFLEKSISFYVVDLEKKEEVDTLPSDITHIVHCAALSSPWGTYEAFYQANVVATKHILEFAKSCKHLERMVHVSTPSLYFNHEEKENVKECDVPKEGFANHYAKTKYLAEQEVQQAFQTGLPVVMIRPRALFGERDETILPRLIEVNQKTGIPLLNEGKHCMDVTYVKNVSHAILLCLEKEEHILGKVFNITNQDVRTFHDIITLLFDELQETPKFRRLPYGLLQTVAKTVESVYQFLHIKKEPLLTTYTVSVLAKTQTLNNDVAQNELGYYPIYSVEEGLHRYVKWLKEERK